MSIGNGAPAWPSVIVSNGRISRSEHIQAHDPSGKHVLSDKRLEVLYVPAVDH